MLDLPVLNSWFWQLHHFIFVSVLVPGQCRESCTTSSHMERMSRYPAEKFLCTWHQVTEKLLLCAVDYSLIFVALRFEVSKCWHAGKVVSILFWFVCHSNVAGRRCIVRSSSMLLLRLAPCMLEPFRAKPTKLRQERTPILQEAVKRIWGRHAAYSTDNRPMAVKS